ncbi:DUF3489 domain-containing protein [Magnetospirillum sp. SS-4]|uniref:DUF3489 domain-containing protein n=1 Tax=Magnetospirillum sp. SS-4 TaxID=2681465 RepID=UPI00138222E9|nr:DUF3489 domain-containing protein [Magnetospirillum sp. SS-4]CAA7624176.1 conserved hypothetical protein [Magnetospirillum sp. SS-4]
MTQQIQLSETQTTILAAACSRDDRRVFPVTAKLKGGAVGNVLKNLLKKGLIEEIASKDDATVWRVGEDGTPLTLRATATADAALGIETADDAEPEEAEAPAAPRRQREGSKQEALIAMLKRPEGASIAEITAEFGWQAHTVRGAIAGALKKKLGLEVTSEKIEGRGRIYKIQD